MHKPEVKHAGCGGRVTAHTFGNETTLLCAGCNRSITDPRELTPRGGFKPEPRVMTHLDQVSA